MVGVFLLYYGVMGVFLLYYGVMGEIELSDNLGNINKYLTFELTYACNIIVVIKYTILYKVTIWIIQISMNL